jgi:hypothetical protein
MNFFLLSIESIAIGSNFRNREMGGNIRALSSYLNSADTVNF